MQMQRSINHDHALWLVVVIVVALSFVVIGIVVVAPSLVVGIVAPSLVVVVAVVVVVIEFMLGKVFVIFFSIASRFTFCCCNIHMQILSNMLAVFM